MLAINGLSIVSAAAHSEDGVALSQFNVKGDDYDSARLESQLLAGMAGKLALESRVAERRTTYARAQRRTSARKLAPRVTFDNRLSHNATVIEVNCRDEIGALYMISKAMSEMGLEILTARIQTIGDAIIDAFYVRDSGKKVTDQKFLTEIERAILFAIQKT